MKNKEQYLDEIKEIRQMMEQSSRFLSLSGLSGILIGIYSLVGAYLAYRLLYLPPPSGFWQANANNLLIPLAEIALVVLALSLVTIVVLTFRKTKHAGNKFWGKGTRLMLINLAVPLVSGGILIVILVSRGVYEIASPAFLIFYGLALVNAAKFTRKEIFYMGLCQISLGIIAAWLPGYSLLLWALGFGIIHILYGTVMHFRYDHKSKTQVL